MTLRRHTNLCCLCQKRENTNGLVACVFLFTMQETEKKLRGFLKNLTPWKGGTQYDMHTRKGEGCEIKLSGN